MSCLVCHIRELHSQGASDFRSVLREPHISVVSSSKGAVMDSFQTLSWGDLDSQKVFLASTIAVSVILIVFYKFIGERKGNLRSLPGPRPWPIIGNLGLLGPLAHRDFTKLAKEYGGIFRLHLGTVDCVVVSSSEMAKEILKTHDNAFSSRPDTTQARLLTYNRQDGATTPYGPYVRDMKRILTQELLSPKRLQKFQNLRKQEIMSMLQAILEDCKTGNAVRVRNPVSNLTKNNVTHMAFSKKFFGPKFSGSYVTDSTSFNQIFKEVVRLFAVFYLGDYIPFLKYIDVQGLKKQMRAAIKGNDVFFDKIIEEHQQLLPEKSQSSVQLSQGDNMDLVDVLLTRPTEANDGKPFTPTQIKAIVVTTLIAGTETTSSTVEWAMAELLKHPAILIKAQDELDAVVGRDRLVEESDFPNLEYIRAIATETLRLHPILPLLVPHHSKESCDVAGYHVPVNAIVFINAWAIGRDPGVWERALEFEPDRFLNNQRVINGQDFDYLPFGAGRRVCPGKGMALLMIQYALAVLLQAFTWSLPPGVEPKDVDLSEAPAFTMAMATPIEASASPRLPLRFLDKDYPQQ